MSNQKITIGISIISHNDEIDVIKNHGAYKNNYEDISFKVAITNNLQKESLREFCSNRNYNHIVNKNKKGFGENNNQNINLLLDQDLIFLVNPDVYFDLDEFVKHIRNIYNQSWDICGANVIEENRLRKTSHRRLFPALLDPLISLFLKKKVFLLDPNISSEVDWVGGSFMLIRTDVFKKLKGFDVNFFMYYEDIDFCKRAKKLGMKVYYFSEFSFHHQTKRAGHKLFTKAFFWNIKSMIRYFLKHPTLRLVSPNKY